MQPDPDEPRRGQVWRYAGRVRGYPALVLSTHVMHAQSSTAYVVELLTEDPDDLLSVPVGTYWATALRLQRVPRAQLHERLDAPVTATTMQAIEVRLRAILGL